MHINWEASIQPTIICFCVFVLFCFFWFFSWGGGCWRTEYNVCVVHQCVFIEKLLYTQLLLGFSCFFLFFGAGWEGGGLDMNYFFVNKFIFIEEHI
jgi:hypothetical protein